MQPFREITNVSSFRPGASAKAGALGGLGASRRGNISSMGGTAAPRQARPGGKGDPRPLSDSSFQAACREKIRNFLTRHNYEKPVTSKMLSAPSTSDYYSWVEFVFKQWSPLFRLPPTSDPSSAEWVLAVFRGLRYPFMLQKNSLNPIAPHAYPALLAALAWLVELHEADERMKLGPTINMGATDMGATALAMSTAAGGLALTGTTTGEQGGVDQIWMAYLCESFRHWTHTGKSSAKVDADFSRRLEEIFQRVAKELAALEDEKALTLRGVDEARAAVEAEKADQAATKQALVNLASDDAKYDQFNQQMALFLQDRMRMLEAVMANAAAIRARIDEKTAAKAQLEAQVAALGISQEDRIRFATERAQLEKQLKDAEESHKEKQRSTWDLEQEVCRRVAELSRRHEAHQDLIRRVRSSCPAKSAHELAFLDASRLPEPSSADSEARYLAELKGSTKAGIHGLLATLDERMAALAEHKVVLDESTLRAGERAAELETARAELARGAAENEERVARMEEDCARETARIDAALAAARADMDAKKSAAVSALASAKEALANATTEAEKKRKAEEAADAEWMAAMRELGCAIVEAHAHHSEAAEALCAESASLRKASLADITAAMVPPALGAAPPKRM
eukprot:m51a1_g6880 putative kinetochore protein ndc80 homolog (632) ;mRNA; r:218110-221469